MKISMLTTTFPKFPSDSHGTFVFSIANSLKDANYSVTVVTPSANDIPSSTTFEGIEVIRFRYFFKPLEQVAYGANIPTNLKHNKIAKLAFPFFVTGFLWGAIKHLFKADVIHAQFGYSGVFATFASNFTRNKKPIIISFYGRDTAHAFKFPKIYQYAFRHAKKILALSNDMKQHLVQAGCSADKIIVHHLGVDLNQFKLQYQEKTNNNHVTLLTVANFVKKKGIHLAIKALAKVLEEAPDKRTSITLKLVGNGPEKEALEKLAATLNLQENLSFLDNYETPNPRQTVVDEMAKADIFILPSEPIENDYGGTPVVLMEASAMRLPVITTDDAGNSEIILHNKTGIVVPQNDVGSLADAMNKLISDSSLRTELGEAGHQHIENEFNHEKQMKKLQQTYESIC